LSCSKRNLLESVSFLSTFTTKLRPSDRKCFSTLMTMFRWHDGSRFLVVGHRGLSARQLRRSRASLSSEKIIARGFHCTLNNMLRRCSFEGRWCSSKGFVSVRRRRSGRNSIFTAEDEKNEITRATISKVRNCSDEQEEMDERVELVYV
jgi:hypothetical protein